jgi:hypothetical protein
MGNEVGRSEDLELSELPNNRRVSRMENHLNTIITNYSSKDIEIANPKFHSVKKGEFEIYGQLDENGQVSGYGTLRRNGSIVFEGEFL